MPGFRGLTAPSSSSTIDTPCPSPGSEAPLSPTDPQVRRVQSNNTQEQATAGALVFIPEVGGGALELLLMGFRMFPYPGNSAYYSAAAYGDRSREEAMWGGNNVVGCLADCQPRSESLLSTPLGLTATSTAHRGKSPLIWSWKERGKVILGCLRRWVISPQLLARTRGCSSVSRRQVAAPRRAWGRWPTGKQPAGSDALGWGPARVGVGAF